APRRAREPAELPRVNDKYGRLTADRRADHIATLRVLAHQVTSAPASPTEWRRFVVVTIDAGAG
ncbi:MAG TPA: hypothetical protein VK607_21165, partial [Kofleriaceae bacterium]|nr:hypothetical protein [Kofleriaceae bacterium]